MCKSVRRIPSTTNMELVGAAEGERDSIRKSHAWKLPEEQDRVLRNYYAQRGALGGQRKLH